MNIKKIIAREGLIFLGFVMPSVLFYFAQVYIFHTGSKNDQQWVYLYWTPKILKVMFSLYGAYWLIRFVVWAIKTLKPQPTKSQSPDFTDYAEMIIHLRKEKGITAIELAEKMGVSPAYIARLEMGEAKPTAEQIEVIRSFLK